MKLTTALYIHSALIVANLGIGLYLFIQVRNLKKEVRAKSLLREIVSGMSFFGIASLVANSFKPKKEDTGKSEPEKI